MTASVTREALRPLAGLTAGVLALLLSACGATWTPLDGDGDGVSIAEGDCDESPATGASISPNAAEIAYDGIDQNCNGNDDENDKDGDGVAAVEFGGTDCWDDPDIVPDAFVALNGLPQLGAADVFPGAPTDAHYDGIDQDCAGDGDFDQDGDGFDSVAWPQRDGSVGGDCWDADDEDAPTVATCNPDGSGATLTAADVNPEASESSPLDGIDQDCSADATVVEFDVDGDSFPFCEECDDADASIFPDPTIPEVWYNGVDENCDLNDGDQDGDGYVDAGYTGPLDPDGDGADNFQAGDCWDTPEARPDAYAPLNDLPALEAGAVNPGAQADAPYDGVDADCAGGDDFDVDGDGVRTAAFPDRAGATGADCDDVLATVRPGADDALYDGIDSDCGGEDDYDGDGDGHVAPAYDGLATQYAPGTGGLPADDCDDANEDAHGGVPSEDCATDFDDDCDGSDNAVDALACTVFHDDADRDGFGAAASTQCSCAPIGSFDGTPALATDCDDSPTTGAGRTPGRAEIPGDGIDQDCDALGVDSCYEDLDEDGFGTDTVVIGLSLDCAADAQRAKVAGDCLDVGFGARRTYPGVASHEASGACMRDLDEDGYGDNAPAAGITAGEDCDDGEGAIFPGAVAEATATQCMRDADSDGFGDVTPPAGFDAGTDCNDAVAAIKPGATDLPVDGIDQDCDSREVCYVDADGDGVGTPSTTVSLTGSCSTTGYSIRADDCYDDPGDPRAAVVYPGAAMLEADASRCRLDADGDGFGDQVVPTELVDAGVEAGTDCADDDDATFPRENGVSGWLDAAGCMTDADDDAYGDGAPTADGVVAGSDCDDGDDAFHPYADEVPVDGLDQDCNAKDACFEDLDEDGFGSTMLVDAAGMRCADDPTVAVVSTDCDDSPVTGSAIYPGASGDVVGDEVDQDCDGKELCFVDGDGDGVGDDGHDAFTVPTVLSPDTTCSAAGESTEATDCDDADGTVNPRATEGVADGRDQDCDGMEACYLDDDRDGYGTDALVGNTVLVADLSCATAGSSASGDDCNDAASAIHPGMADTAADGVDSDCDASESCYADADGDSYRDTTLTAFGVTAGTSGNCTGRGRALAVASQDCDDDATAHGPDAFHAGAIAAGGAAAIHAGAVDTPADGVNQDCSAGDTCYVDADHDTYGSASTMASTDLDCTDLGTGTGGSDEADEGTDCLDSGANASLAYPRTNGVADNSGSAWRDASGCMLDVDGDRYGRDTAPGTGDAGADCDDANVQRNPSATELVGNEVDEDCDTTEICYVNSDADAYRVGPSGAQLASSVAAAEQVASANLRCSDAGEAASSVANGDCLDAGADAAATYPRTNGIAGWQDGSGCLTDADGDTYGAQSVAAGVTAGTDCLDSGAAAASTFPRTNGVSGWLDASGCMTDADGDAYGARAASGGVTAGGDCDDTPGVHGADAWHEVSANGNALRPGLTDTVADRIDQDCSGLSVGAGTAGVDRCYADTDSDGFGASLAFESTGVAADLDCTDTDVSGTTDESTLGTDCLDAGTNAAATYPRTNGASGWLDASGCMTDADGDKYGAIVVTGGVTAGADCDDVAGEHAGGGADTAHGSGTLASGAAIRPNATDTPVDGINQDCSAGDVCYVDADSDTFGSTGTLSSADLDCSDTDVSGTTDEANDSTDCLDTGANAASAFPGAAPNDSATACMMDADGDNWGSTTRPGTTGDVGTDCLDAGTGPGGELAVAVNTSATEVCDANNFDEDCDTLADDADGSTSATGKVTYYKDDDGDGFANLASAGTPTCDPQSPYIALASSCTAAQLLISPNCDCNDNPTNNGALMDPGNTEVCDAGNVDEDCDGAWDDNDTGGASGKVTYYADSDGDGYGNASSSVSRCDAPTGYVINSSDCATVNAAGAQVLAVDGDSRTYPGATEFCDGVRTNCDVAAATSDDGLLSYTTSGPSAGYTSSTTYVNVAGTYTNAASPLAIAASAGRTYNICKRATLLNSTTTAYLRFSVASGTVTLRGCIPEMGAACNTVASADRTTVVVNANASVNSAASVLTAASGSTVNLANLTLRGGYAATNGGAIAASGSATVRGTYVTLTANNAVNGGAISIDTTGWVSMQNSYINANVATTRGGAVYVAGGTGKFYCSGTTVYTNRVSGTNNASAGGAVYLNNAAACASFAACPAVCSSVCNFGTGGNNNLYVNSTGGTTSNDIATRESDSDGSVNFNSFINQGDPVSSLFHGTYAATSALTTAALNGATCIP